MVSVPDEKQLCDHVNVSGTGTHLLVYLPFRAVQKIHELPLCLLQHLLSHVPCNSHVHVLIN